MDDQRITLDQWITLENIARYQRLLEAGPDSAKRSLLERLLAECIAQLPLTARRVPLAKANGTPDRAIDSVLSESSRGPTLGVNNENP
jgi:hypothetical protein